MDPYVIRQTVSGQLDRWQSMLAAHPHPDVHQSAGAGVGLPESIVTTLRMALGEALQIDGVTLAFSGSATGLQLGYEITLPLGVAAQIRYPELCVTLSKGVFWLAEVLIGDELLDQTTRQRNTTEDLHAAYVRRVWASLKLLHSYAESNMRAACASICGGNVLQQRVLSEVLAGSGRWKWVKPDGGLNAEERLYVDALRAQEQLLWVEAVALTLAVVFARAAANETDYEPFMAIQTLAIGRAARLEKKGSGSAGAEV